MSTENGGPGLPNGPWVRWGIIGVAILGAILGGYWIGLALFGNPAAPPAVVTAQPTRGLIPTFTPSPPPTNTPAPTPTAQQAAGNVSGGTGNAGQAAATPTNPPAATATPLPTNTAAPSPTATPANTATNTPLPWDPLESTCRHASLSIL